MTSEQIPEELDFASIDVSFISLGLILPALRPLMRADAEVVALVKPQFEAGRDKVGRKGVVREKSTHLEVIEAVMVFARSIGFEILNLEYSPIKGPEGNIEYLMHIRKGSGAEAVKTLISLTVKMAHEELSNEKMQQNRQYAGE